MYKHYQNVRIICAGMHACQECEFSFMRQVLSCEMKWLLGQKVVHCCVFTWAHALIWKKCLNPTNQATTTHFSHLACVGWLQRSQESKSLQCSLLCCLWGGTYMSSACVSMAGSVCFIYARVLLTVVLLVLPIVYYLKPHTLPCAVNTSRCCITFYPQLKPKSNSIIHLRVIMTILCP